MHYYPTWPEPVQEGFGGVKTGRGGLTGDGGTVLIDDAWDEI